jgi:RNA polymerase sigma-70 factor (ECF subfamily)
VREKQSLLDETNRRRRFEAIFHATHPRVLAYALRRSANRESAEEVVSETYLIAWRRFDVMPAEHPLPWLLGTARRVHSNQRRHAARRSPKRGDSPSDAVDAPDPGTPIPEALAEREAFAAAFAALRERDRVSIRLHRARQRLLKELKRTGHSLGEANEQPPLVERPGTTEA